MSRTITALFDNQADAEAGRQRLLDANIHSDNVRIYDKTSIGETGYSSRSEPGMWASIKNAFLPDEDRHTYEEGVRRGGYLLVADVGDHEADDAVRALDNADVNSIDVDERANQWKAQGWMPPVAGSSMAGGSMAGASMGSASTAGASMGSASTAGASMGGPSTAGAGMAGAALSAGERDTRSKGYAGEEARIPVVEEQLVVGKREVERGGVRVRSYVTEQPVHEQIRLREERVNVERHPVDRPVDADAFREQTLEVRATAEEAVVQKSARVVEEVIVGKQVGERQQQITDTVRHTEVNVERLDGGNDLADDDSYYRTHFQSNYATAGESYDTYAPAYRYGSTMRSDARYSGRQWDDVESDLRTDWESRNAGTGSSWEKMKAAVRHGWDRMTGDNGVNRSY